jgi:hypothetical protein
LLSAKLNTPEVKDALLVALNFDGNHPGRTLGARRKSYQARLKPWAHIRTLQHREDKGIAALARLLDSEDPDNSGAGKEQKNPKATSIAIVNRDLQVIEQASTYFFSADGVILRKNTMRAVKALVPNADPRMDVAHQYLAESRPSILKMHADFGCSIVGHDEASNGAIVDTLEIFKRLDPDDGLYPLGYHLVVDSRLRSTSVVRWQPEPPHAERIEFHLVFHPRLVPLRAWWFAVPNDLLAQIEPNRDDGQHLEVHNEGQYIFKIFEGEKYMSNLHYGIAWIWPPD